MDQIRAGIDPLGIKEYTVSQLSDGFTEKGFAAVKSRKEAIYLAIRLAKPGDIVLLAGKGHEDYQIIGSQRIHFDDREEAAAAMRERLDN